MQERKEYRYLDQLTERYPCLSAIRPELEKAYETLRECYAKGGKLLAAGNGGSCADSEHIVGELMKGFVKRRELPEEMKAALKQADPWRGTVRMPAAGPSGYCPDGTCGPFHCLCK